MTTMTGTAKGDPSGIGGSAAIRPGYARVAQASAATAFFFLFADSLASPSGRALVSRAGGDVSSEGGQAGGGP
jgi:hypothetical protein